MELGVQSFIAPLLVNSFINNYFELYILGKGEFKQIISESQGEIY